MKSWWAGIIWFVFTLTVKIKGLEVIRFCNKNGNRAEFTNENCGGGILQQVGAPDSLWDCVCATGAWMLSLSICLSNTDDPQSLPYFIYAPHRQHQMTCWDRKNLMLSRNTHPSLVLTSSLTLSGDPVLLTSPQGLLLKPTITPYGFHFVINAAAQCYQNDHHGLFWIVLVDPKIRWGVRLNEDLSAICLLPATSSKNSSPAGIYIYDVSILCAKRTYSREEMLFLTLVEECEYENGAEWVDVPPTKVSNVSFDTTNSVACADCRRQDEIQKKPCCSAGTSELEYDTDLQSSRIGIHLLNKILKSSEQFELDTFDPYEVKVLTKAALIALTACDPKVIPVTFYKYFLIMFKALLWEFPPERSITSENSEEIHKALSICQKKTKRYKIQFEQKCYQGMTMSSPTTKTQVHVPPEVKWRSNYDILLEVIWKLGSFLSYHCLQYFPTETIYHHELRTQLDAMFSKMQLRWVNPGNSNKMYAHLLQFHLDLNESMTNFDLCVGSAQAASFYEEDVWLKRPFDPDLQKTPGNHGNAKNSYKQDIGKNDVQSRATLTSTFNCFNTLASFLTTTQIPLEMCWLN